ncbi:MAG TPA: hypothetical protein PK986_04760 [Spirochaetota bacterium]|nr:hypothetical protein [Spirochaetota bacterium]HQO39761.1 hypothetical protein [Spirochaetota bacterium]
MSQDQIFTSIDEFIKTVKELGIKKIAFSEVNERRAEQTTDSQLEVVVYRKVDLLTYKESVIYKYSERSDDLNPLYERLVSEGFDVTRINKNIT